MTVFINGESYRDELSRYCAVQDVVLLNKIDMLRRNMLVTYAGMDNADFHTWLKENVVQFIGKDGQPVAPPFTTAKIAGATMAINQDLQYFFSTHHPGEAFNVPVRPLDSVGSYSEESIAAVKGFGFIRSDRNTLIVTPMGQLLLKLDGFLIPKKAAPNYPVSEEPFFAPGAFVSGDDQTPEDFHRHLEAESEGQSSHLGGIMSRRLDAGKVAKTPG